MPERFHERVLNRLVRLRAVAEILERDAKAAPLMDAHQLTETRPRFVHSAVRHEIANLDREHGVGRSRLRPAFARRSVRGRQRHAGDIRIPNRCPVVAHILITPRVPKCLRLNFTLLSVLFDFTETARLPSPKSAYVTGR